MCSSVHGFVFAIAALTRVRVRSADTSSAAGLPGHQFTPDAVDPVSATVGTGQLISGLDTGLLGLCASDRATIVVPPELAYGDEVAGGAIPAAATLRLEVEIKAVRGPTNRLPPPDLFREIDTSRNNMLDAAEVEAHFERLGKGVPPALWTTEDANGNGVIEWEEFGGPKGLMPEAKPQTH